MNFFVKSYFLIALSCFGLELYGKKYHAKCQMYTDPFGPLKTGYTMGDLVRYSVHPLNIYYGIVTPPLGAQDIKNYGDNPANLYNALGYLYAGWAALHNNAVNFSTWVGSYRQPGGNPFQSNPQKALLEFDNNQYGQHNISYPMTFPAGWSTGIGYFTPQGGDYNNAFTGFSAHVVDEQPATMTNANASFGWCPNVNDGNYVLYFGDNPTVDYDNLSISSAYVYPIGQFCGARIAHILGAVVNDIPWSDDNAQSGASGGTTAFESPLISGVNGNGTALPMIAVMSGNAAGWAVSGSGATATSTPVGMFQPSTAHFGSMQTFLSKLSKPLGNNVGYNYLINHFSPAVSRLSSLCSYKISQDATALNLIEIEDSKVTAYDNGLVIAIQNNTGDQLQINQVGSSASNQIGALDEGGNNYYLHTASLMKGQTAPDQTQMISITDSSSDVVGGTYIQVLSSVQLQQLVDAVNSTSEQIIIDGQALPGLNYNQIMSGYTVPTDITPAYVVVTNFNPMLDSNNKLSSLNLPADSASRANILNSYRIQAINVAEFLLKPYFLTLQINKENIGYGVQTNYKKDASGNYVSNADGNYEIAGYSLSSGAPNNYILYACMSTVNIFTWQNYLHTIKNKRYPQPRHYSHIPLMMVPDTVMDYDLLGIKNYSGLKAYYLIWLIAYSAAMTEVAADWSKGILPLINTVFNLPQNFYNKVIIDQNGQLQSGKTLNLGNEFLGNNIMTLCACDTWDSGGGFNQDIPILNLYTDSQGNIVPNKSGSDYINLVLTFEPEYNFSLQQKLMNNYFAYRGIVYNNNVLVSLPAQALKDGVDVQITQIAAGNYQLTITSKNDYSDQLGNIIQAGSILSAPKIFIDTNLFELSSFITIDFLRRFEKNIAKKALSNWKSPVLKNWTQKNKPFKFSLMYQKDNSGKHILQDVSEAKSSKSTESVYWSGDVRWTSGGTTPLKNPPSEFNAPYLFFMSARNSMGEVTALQEYALENASQELVFGFNKVLSKLSGDNYVKFVLDTWTLSLEQMIIQSGSNPYIKSFLSEVNGVIFYNNQNAAIPYAQSFYVWDGIRYINSLIPSLGKNEYISVKYISGEKFGIFRKSIGSKPKQMVPLK